EQKEGLNHYDKASCHLLQYQILFWQGEYKELIKHAKQTYKESGEWEKNLVTVDNLLIMTNALVGLYRFDEASDLIKQGEELLKTLTQELPKDYKHREASIARFKGNVYELNLEFDLAVEHFEHSIALSEEIGATKEIAKSLIQIGWVIGIYNGELDRALDYVKRGMILAKENNMKFYSAHGLNIMASLLSIKGENDRSILIFEKSLTIFKELKNKVRMASVLNNIGEAYRKKGDLDRALECLEQSLALGNEVGILEKGVLKYDYLIQILVEKGDLDRAQQYLHDLEELNNQLKGKYNLMYLLDKAIVLKTSLRTRDRGKAEEIFVQLLENENLDYEFLLRALLNLCELLLSEFQMTGDLEVIEEIDSLIVRLLDIAEKSHSYWIMGETYLLETKLALLSLDLNKARRLLTQGQEIAERYGLKLLAIKISNEHDELLKQLNMWENLKESTSSLKERMEFTRLSEQIENMTRRRHIEVPGLLNEDPVFLFIVSEGGRPIFSISFEENQSFEDYLFGGFFTAINSFVDEKFSEGLDRVSFGEHTLLMNSLSPFFICYIFKGQSYVAQQRVRYFIDKIQNDEQVWQIFTHFNNLNREIELKDIPSLEPLINEIFMDKTILLNGLKNN
ncbi:hypothetical protein LCGC14_1296290, partial [marine sediment metagenome]